MIPLDVLLDMVVTEALEDKEDIGKSETFSCNKPGATLPPMGFEYRLELIKTEDGKYIWVE